MRFEIFRFICWYRWISFRDGVRLRTSSGQLIKIIQKGIKLKRDGRKELIVNVVNPKTGMANYVPLRFLMEMQFFDRQYVKPIDGDYTNLKLSNLIPVDRR